MIHNKTINKMDKKDKLINLLVAALKKCSYQLQTWEELDSWSAEDEKAYCQAEKAIAKATGKKQINGLP